ncbi:MAG TPA: 4-hydroxyphenylacetate 3-hydroxylase N-terminal domain-containing protein [bacterium]|nr:4-hydroxyphenylacetate 3-hydroxylase N-terminal domain-containing protein [bacterium]
MSLRTPDQYMDALRAMRPNVYKFGELINDVTTHPATRRAVNGHARLFAAGQNPDEREIVTTQSDLTGGPVSRYLSLMRSADDVVAVCRMKRWAFQQTGTCTGGRCVGGNALNAMWATTYDLDNQRGTDYHARLRAWLKSAQERDIACCGALTDPKGDRSKSPSQQADPDMNLHVVERRPDGVVVRGAKVMIAGSAAAEEVFVLPGTGCKKGEEDWAIAFVVPRDVVGLTVVEARRPSDTRETEPGYDVPSGTGGITQGYLLFDNVFVPNERIFLNGEVEFTAASVLNFIMPYRSAIGGCVAGQGDVKIGAAILAARSNGLSSKAFRDKLVAMQINNETTYGVGIAAATLGKQHPSGVWIPDPLLANVNKVHVATLPYETSRLAQEIAGGIAETGCMPSSVDLENSEYGDKLKRYLGGAVDGDTRYRVARLIEWLTIGAGVPGCMHGGGSPDGAKLMVRLRSDWEGAARHAGRLAGVKQVPSDPA